MVLHVFTTLFKTFFNIFFLIFDRIFNLYGGGEIVSDYLNFRHCDTFVLHRKTVAIMMYVQLFYHFIVLDKFGLGEWQLRHRSQLRQLDEGALCGCLQLHIHLVYLFAYLH